MDKLVDRGADRYRSRYRRRRGRRRRRGFSHVQPEKKEHEGGRARLAAYLARGCSRSQPARGQAVSGAPRIEAAGAAGRAANAAGSAQPTEQITSRARSHRAATRIVRPLASHVPAGLPGRLHPAAGNSQSECCSKSAGVLSRRRRVIASQHHLGCTVLMMPPEPTASSDRERTRAARTGHRAHRSDSYDLARRKRA